MQARHGDHTHDVYVMDDGTLDTVILVDGQELRMEYADRDASGEVRPSWLRDAARDACDDGLLEDLFDPTED
jgi:hypothetical protein